MGKRGKPLPHGGWALRFFQGGGKSPRAFSGPGSRAAERLGARGMCVRVRVRVRVGRGSGGRARASREASVPLGGARALVFVKGRTGAGKGN